MEFEKKAKVSKQVTLGPAVLGLTLFAAVFLGCNTGRVVFESCTAGDDSTCPEGKVCRTTTTTPPGKGICVPAGIETEKEKVGAGGICPLGGDACEDGLLCVEAEGVPAGMGRCVPSVCSDSSPCPSGFSCQVGVCVPNSCSDDKYCPSGWSCINNVCLPDTCTPDKDDECPGNFICSTDGKCVVCDVINDNGCEPDEKCWPTQDGQGQCAPRDCTDSSQCPSGWSCLNNTCVIDTCNSNDQCPDGWACVLNTCVPNLCGVNGLRCPDGWTCVNDTCVIDFCNGGGQCPNGMICSADNTCVNCEVGSNNGCASDEKCWPTNDGRGQCIIEECPNGNECPHGWSCLNGLCVVDTCNNNNECPGGWSCVLNTCVPNTCDDVNGPQCPNGWVCRGDTCVPDTCNNSNECPDDWSCVLGNCVPDICNDNNECPNGWSCVRGICLPDTCTGDSECPSGICVGGTCLICEVGSDRGCNVVAGEKCWPTDDGKGQCALEVCTDDDECPDDWSCFNGTCVIDTCNSNDQCPDGWSCKSNTCVPNICNGLQCPNGWTCLLGQCVPACTVNADCVGGVCVGGACVTCEPGTTNGCNANTEICHATGNGMGVCLPTAQCTVNADCPNDSKCISGQCVPGCTVNADCASGICLANGACATCNPLNNQGCDANTETCHATGNGMGVCLPNAACTVDGDCPNGKCVGGQCVPACTVSADCAVGVCVNNACVTCEPGTTNGCNANTEICHATGNGMGVCLPTAQCTVDAQCNGGKCIDGQCVPACRDNADCVSGLCLPNGACATCNPLNNQGCDANTETCHATGNGMGVCLPTAACTVDGDCPNGKCVGGQCVPACTVSADCAVGVCVNGACVTCDPSNDDGCTGNDKCHATGNGMGVCLPTAQCTVDAQCNGGKCIDGQCVPACRDNADCVSGICLANGACATCNPLNNQGCDANTETCHATGNGMGVCLPNAACTVDGDCPNGKCVGGQCVPACTVSADCAVGVCVNGACVTCDPSNDDGCTGNDKCHATGNGMGVCLPIDRCTDHSDCNGGKCVNGQCVPSCTDNADCASGLCLANGACATCNPVSNQGCGLDEKCWATPDGLGECLPKAACTDDRDCPNGKCVGGQCVPACTVSADCAVGVCVDNACVICEPGTTNGCNANTEICHATGDGMGVCLPTAQCTVDAQCNGGKCVDGQCVPSCRANADCVSGICLPNGACATCNPTNNQGCDANTETCHATGNGMGVCLPTAACTVDGDCPNGKCVGGQCVPACTVSADCAAGICLNGACVTCEPGTANGCNANTEICHATGNGMGVCLPTAQCTVDAQCNGGKCIDGQCVPACRDNADCVSGICLANGACATCNPLNNQGCDANTETCHATGNGMGVCLPNAACTVDGDCPNGKCVGGQCVPACTVSADCAVGVCVNNACVTCEPGTANGCDVNTEICHATGNGMGVCLPIAICTVDADCNGGKCVNGQCVPSCRDNADCVSGICLPNGACATCNPANNQGCDANTETCHATGNGMGVCLPNAACTDDRDCPNGKCVGGQCVPACTVNADCVGGVCVGGACVTCEPGTTNGCDVNTEICHATGNGMGVCLPIAICTVDADCNGGKCVNGQCVPSCRDNADCASGLCLPNGACATCNPADNQGCGLNEKCWATPDNLGMCLPVGPCNDDRDCPDGTCVHGQCVPACTVNADCATGVCLNGACVTCEPGTTNGCDANTEICHATGDGMGVCLPIAICTVDADCNGGKCVNGQCVPACRDNADCVSGLCLANGACATCNPANNQGCDANTETCHATGDGLGVCLPNAACTVDGDCPNGKCVGGQCVPACTVSADCAVGVCVNGACVTCEPGTTNGCDVNTEICHATGNGMGVCLPIAICTVDADCNGGKCVNGQCVPSCRDNADCVSGLCLANGACAICNPDNHQGCGLDEKCWATPDDLGECLPTAQCAVDADCNGGKCVQGQCVPACTTSADCVDGVCVNNACVTCEPGTNNGCDANTEICHATGDGMGVCLPTAICTVDADCNGGKCVNGQCVPACRDNADCVSGLCLANGACATCNPLNNQGCDANTETCHATGDGLGVCLPNAACTDDRDCPNGKCVGGQCVPACTVNADCVGGVCVNNACVTCEPGTTNGCDVNTELCHATGDGMGVCLPTAICTVDADCNGGKCLHGQCVPACTTGADCASGVCLNNACVTCNPNNNDGCYTDEKCWPTPDGMGQCALQVCTDNDECPDNWSCLNNTCVPDTCTNNNQCPNGWSCVNNTCVPNVCNGLRCPNGWTCVNNTCVPDVCSNDNQCPVGICVNSTCVVCDTSNDRGCRTDEICWPTPDGLGICVPESCDPNAVVNPCPENWTCQEPGICVPNECTPGNHEECPEDWVCVDMGNGVGVCEEAGIFEAELGDGTEVPLAWTNGYLVVGTFSGNNGQVHFVNTRTGRVSQSTTLARLTGLATLGNSERAVLTSRQRISTLQRSGDQLINPAMDCLTTAAPFGGSEYFEFGPTLIQTGNADGTGQWRFALPANATWNNRLLAYSPNNNSAPCSLTVLSGQFTGRPALSPMAWLPSSELLYAQKAEDLASWFSYYISRQGWENATSTWGSLSQSAITNQPKLDGVIGMAANQNNLWISAKENDGSRLRRHAWMGTGSNGYPMLIGQASPPALDKDGQAYAVVQRLTDPPWQSDYEVRLYAANITDSHAFIRTGPTIIPRTAPPVGSPILGEPVVSGDVPELYVVTTKGHVYAFRTDTLASVWPRPVELGIDVARTAQPVLKNNRLWIVGTRGEVRGVPVNSKGLSRSAQWPKMHRDNCNSNSYLTAPSPAPELVNCF